MSIPSGTERITTEALERAMLPYIEGVSPGYINGFRDGVRQSSQQIQHFGIATIGQTDPRWLRKDFLKFAHDVISRWNTDHDYSHGLLDGYDVVVRAALRACGINPNNPILDEAEYPE